MTVQCEYYFVPQSPFAYLGHARFTGMTSHLNIDVDVKPCDMNRVFRETGGLPVSQRPLQRQAYRLLELARWSRHLALPLNLHPTYFPVSVDAASRIIIAAKMAGGGKAAMALTGAILRAVWAEEKNIADLDTLTSIATECGLDGASLCRQANDPAIQAAYEQYTNDAIAANVFGAPWYVVDGEGFWGQDRLDFVERALASAAGKHLPSRQV